MTDRTQELGERIAVLETKIKAVEEINDRLDRIEEIMTKAQGAWWTLTLLIGVGAAVGALADKLASWFWR